MIPRSRTDEFLDDLALDINQRRNVLGILPGQVGQQALEVDLLYLSPNFFGGK